MVHYHPEAEEIRNIDISWHVLARLPNTLLAT